MQYRRIGRAGAKVSLLSLGSWITYGNQVDEKASIELMAAARDHGVNFFDNDCRVTRLYDGPVGDCLVRYKSECLNRYYRRVSAFTANGEHEGTRGFG